MALVAHALRFFRPRQLLAVQFCMAVVLLFQAWGLAPDILAADPLDVLPADPRQSDLKSPAEFFGFPIGSRHLRHDQVVDYLQYLSDHSPRATWSTYAHSHGGRPLGTLVITAPQRADRLEELRRQRPKLTTGTADSVSEKTLLVMYMGYGVHGDEASALNASPLIAYHLASSNSQEVLTWLEQAIYLIDPSLNPDGNDRFVNWANENRGRFASAAAIDREHNQPWPGGRTNYYWFDLNRDWLPLTHPESRGRVRLFHQWKPNVVLDFHEMGGTSTYFFQPGVPARTNPLTPKRNQELTRRFAEEHTRAMDEAHELFFTEEQFDDFYIGKGSTYADIHGAVGILFEQGSTRGLRLKNDVTDRHFQDTIANQVRTSLSSLRSASNLRGELLEFQREYYSQALQSGKTDSVRAYILSGSRDRIAAAQNLLKQHAVQAYRSAGEMRLEGRVIAPGQALVIPTAQPQVNLVRSLMEPFQEFEENLFYDVSTWHLPSAMDVECHRYRSDLPEAWLVEGDLPTTNFAAEDAVAGYAFEPTELSAPRVVAALMRMGADVRITTRPMRSASDNAVWVPGTYLILRQPNRQKWESICATLEKQSEQTGIAIEPLASSMTLDGPDLGSNTVQRLPPCKPLLVVGPGTVAGVAGALWHFLDVRLGQPTTVVDTAQFSSAKLHEFTCVILPDGSYSGWSDSQVAALKAFARDGGTIIGVEGAIGWLQSKGLLTAPAESTDSQQASTADNGSTDKEKQGSTASSTYGSAADTSALETIAGAFFMTTIDPTHPLAYGFPDAQVPVFRSSTTRHRLPKNPYQIAAGYQAVIAGYVSQRNRKQLIPSAAVWVENSGAGRVIAIADDPVFRGYVRSSERFLTNALYLGPTINVPPAPKSEDAAD
jgi:hypothetical protein